MNSTPPPAADLPTQGTSASNSPQLPNRTFQGTRTSALLQAPFSYPEAHHSPVSGVLNYPSPSTLPASPAPSMRPQPLSHSRQFSQSRDNNRQYFPNNLQGTASQSTAETNNSSTSYKIQSTVDDGDLCTINSKKPEPLLNNFSQSTTPNSYSQSVISSPASPIAGKSGTPYNSGGFPSRWQRRNSLQHPIFVDGGTTPMAITTESILPSLTASLPLGPLNMTTLIQPVISPTSGASTSILSSIPSCQSRNDKDFQLHRQSTSLSTLNYELGSCHMHSSSRQLEFTPAHNNPYMAPSYTNSWPFVPPKVPGYDFRGGSQAGNLGLMIGNRVSDGMPVTGTLHQSRLLLQHEHRILKRLQIVDSSFHPIDLFEQNFSFNKNPDIESEIDVTTEVPPSDDINECTNGESLIVTQSGLVENGEYFNRVVEDFIDLDQSEISILIMRRLGPNLLSPQHHRFLGLDETDGYQDQDNSPERSIRSPFPDVYTFLIFCLKAACVLEALQKSNLAHLAICPTAFHWSPPNSDVTGPPPANEHMEFANKSPMNPNSLFHEGSEEESHKMSQFEDTPKPAKHRTTSQDYSSSRKPEWINGTKLRLFDFSHSKILSHERVRAPNNIAEWQVAGYLEYHLQYLAPEQTGRADAWMDHRTDIYGLGVTLFTLLTMQFPNCGTDSVQILQGILSRELPPLRMFRSDMPPIIDSILQKMTKKQPSQRYQNAFGFKQDILRCLNDLCRTGTIESFPLGKHDISYKFVLPNTVFGRKAEQQIITTAISQSANAYQNSLNDESFAVCAEEGDVAMKIDDVDPSDHYIFDDIVPLRTLKSTKIHISSKTLLQEPKPFNGGKSTSKGSDPDSIVRTIFVSGAPGVGKSIFVRGMASIARNSGLFAYGTFEADNTQPYSAILSCIKSVLQQLLAQKAEPLASLVVAIRTAFEPNSGIGIVCDLIPELKYFFKGTDLPRSKDIPLTHSVARFHAMILKLIRVISTHFFMTWAIDDIQHADENSLTLLATLVNVHKRLPIILILTHSDSSDCLEKVEHILGGRSSATTSHDTENGSSDKDKTSTTAQISESSNPAHVGVRFIKLQDPSVETIQDYLSALLHRSNIDVQPLAEVLQNKSWLSIRQLVLELYKNHTIFFNRSKIMWDWEACPDTLGHTVRKLTGEEYSFMQNRFRALDCDAKKILVCAAICGTGVNIQDLQHLASKAYVWTAQDQKMDQKESPLSRPKSEDENGAMAGLQSVLKEGILVYTSSSDHLRWHHSIMRKVAVGLLDGTNEKERLHYEMVKILVRTPDQELKAASHILQCIELIRKIASNNDKIPEEERPHWAPVVDSDTPIFNITTKSLRSILSRAAEKSQKSGAQNMAMSYWNAALSLLPENCWDSQVEISGVDGSEDIPMVDESGIKKTELYYEALNLHLQCIEAERWRENYDCAMEICDIALANIIDPIDRAKVFQPKIEMHLYGYGSPEKATQVAIQCLHELGLPKSISFTPTEEEMHDIYDKAHAIILKSMDDLTSDNPKVCNDPRIMMLLEVLATVTINLYYNNVQFLAIGASESVKLVCEHGITEHAGFALIIFALTHTAWHECFEQAYELGLVACKLSNQNHVKFLHHISTQNWGDHIANSIPALEETMASEEIICDRLFHVAGLIHAQVTNILIGRSHLNDCMASATDILHKHKEFGPKAHGIEVMHGIIQLIKCLKGQTLNTNPDTFFDDDEFSESDFLGKDLLAMSHNNQQYSVLKVLAAFIYGHYEYINEVSDTWHDSMMSFIRFEGTWISYFLYGVVALALANLLKTEKNPATRAIVLRRLFVMRDNMSIRAAKYPTNHASMFHLLEAEIADQSLEGKEHNLKSIMLLYEKAISYAIQGNFPLHLCFSYELAAKCHLQHGLITSAKSLMTKACKVYQDWGARGKVSWFYKVYPDLIESLPETKASMSNRGLFYRPNDGEGVKPLAGMHSMAAPINNSFINTSASSASGTPPWITASPRSLMHSPNGFGLDGVSAAAAAIADSWKGTNIQGPSATSNIQSGWDSTPQSPEMEHVDLDILDFSSVIESMQVIASEIDLNRLLVKSLGVLNQAVGAKRCSIMISKDREPLLAASLGDSGYCESVNPPLPINQCDSLFHGIINYVTHTSTLCYLTNAKDDPRFCSDDYIKQRSELKTILCAPIQYKAAVVGLLYMEDFPERVFANRRMLVMNLLLQQLGISITNASLYQSALQSETKLIGLLENMPCGIALWDANATVCQYINNSWYDMTGFTLNEITDSKWQVLTHPDEITIYGLHWQERVLAGVPSQWESRYMLKDGTYRWGLVRMLPIRSSLDNKIIQWLSVTIDIDDQRRAVQLKSNFLANMSHELRTPFSGILGMLSLLRDSSGLSTEQFEFIDMATGSCEMLIRIVDDLLNFSKLEADKVTLEYIPFIFEEILGDVCDLLIPLASRKGLELVVLYDPTMPLFLIGDPDRMKQILMNLIGNAIKFSTSGNVVIEFWHERRKREDIIRMREEKSSQDIVKYLGNMGKNPPKPLKADIDDSKLGDEIILKCSVKDQGIGMTPKEQKMLFVSFQQTDNGTTRKYGGTGLGLSIVSQLIKHMHGEIVVESEKDKGSTFTFTATLRAGNSHDEKEFPDEAARIAGCYVALDARLGAIKNKKVLILSPNRELREQITRTAHGAIYTEFDTLEDALASKKILMTGESSLDRADGMEVDEGREKSWQNNTYEYSSEDLMYFDFILVDHVLDSADLDRIYPSPNIAFILLLAPTKETLRWILPPAEKQKVESQEPESDQLDIGGRGRVNRKEAEMSKAAAHAVSKLPSKLFKKRKTRGYVTVIRPVPHVIGETFGPEVSKLETSTFQVCRMIKPIRRMKFLQIFFNAVSLHNNRDYVPSSEWESSSSAYDGLSEHGDTDRRSTISGDDGDETSEANNRESTVEPSPPVSPSHIPSTPPALSPTYSGRSLSSSPISISSPSAYSLKRRREQALSEAVCIANAESDESKSTSNGTNSKRRPKARRRTAEDSPPSSISEDGDLITTSVTPKPQLPLPSCLSNPLDKRDKKSARYPVPKSTGVKGKVEEDKDVPRRIRSNDAITTILTAEEQDYCRGKNVLVAEDDFVNQKIMEKQLVKLGMNVTIANNGQEAIDRWLSVERGYYSIGIFDHHMPVMDGLAATKKLRSIEDELAKEHKDGRFVRLPIVGLSADIQQHTKELSIRAGMNDYMTKPLLTKGLANIIRHYCINSPFGDRL